MTTSSLRSTATRALDRVRTTLRSTAVGLLVTLGLLVGPPLAARTAPVGRDDGMSTAEYAVGTVAAVAFAAVLYKVVRSDAVSSALSSIVRGALNVSL